MHIFGWTRWEFGLAGIAALLFVAGPVHAQTSREIHHQAVRRTALIANLDAAKDAPRPLLVILHGRRPPELPHRTSERLDALAVKERFVIAYPAGLEGRWNYPGQGSPPSRAGGDAADDIGFVLKLVDALIADNIADRQRIYVSGTSNGALLTFGLICQHGDRLAAAAALISSMYEAQMSACEPARPVPLLAIAGTDDWVQSYDGWLGPFGRLTSVPETLEFWRRKHGCSGQTRSVLPAGRDGDPTRIVRVDWTGCTHDGALSLYRVEGGGHTLPSRSPPDTGQGVPSERRSTVFETSEQVWQFLKRWSL